MAIHQNFTSQTLEFFEFIIIRSLDLQKGSYMHNYKYVEIRFNSLKNAWSCLYMFLHSTVIQDYSLDKRFSGWLAEMPTFFDSCIYQLVNSTSAPL